MKRYAIEYEKRVVVEVEAASADEARDKAYELASTALDGAWDHAQPMYVAIADESDVMDSLIYDQTPYEDQ